VPCKGQNLWAKARRSLNVSSGEFSLLQKAVCIVVVATFVTLGTYTTCSAGPALSGSFETALAFDLSDSTLIIQANSDTYSKLKLDYTTCGWTFESLSTFDMSGLLTQQFSASGSLGLIVLNSQLLFSPILGSGSGLISDTKSANGIEHQYDLGTSYFVAWVSVTSITVVPAGTQWRIKTSIDGATWDWYSSQVFTGSVPSGQVSVGRLARYVTIYVTAGGYIDDSAVTVSVSGESWITTARLVTEGVTLTGTLTIASGASSFSFGIVGAHVGNLPVTGTIYFDILKPDCSLCFDRFEGTFDFPFACLDEVTATLKVNCPQTGSDIVLNELSLATEDIDVGLSWLTFDLKVAFMVPSKTVTLTPTLNLGTCTCFTVYSALNTGAGPWEITALSLYGIGVTYDWNGVSFESLTYLDGIHFVKDTYWEKFVIKSTGDACCEGRFTFEVATYFQDTHTTLFDWAETDVEASIRLTSAFTASTKIVIDTTGLTDVILGIAYIW